MGAPTANVGGFRRFDAASVVRRRVTPFALPRRQRRTALDESQSLAAQRRFDAERCSRDAISSPQFLSGREFVPAADLLSCADKKVGKEAAPASSPRFARCPALLRKTAWLRNSPFSGAVRQNGAQTVLAIALRASAVFLPLLGEAEGGIGRRLTAAPF